MSDDARLGERLRAVALPDEEAARERSRRVVLAGFAEHAAGAGGAAGATGATGAGVQPGDARRAPAFPRARLLPSLAAAAAVAIAFLTLTSPGQAVSNWVREAIGVERTASPGPRPALERLPAGGSLLVRSPEGPWVVRADGSKRLLGPYGDATWSPRARFVGATRPGGLLAVEPGGRVHWTLARPGARSPRWAPSGFRVSYLAGGSVRVVAGDGTGDRSLGRGVAAEWRPLADRNVLAIARADGSVRVLDVDSRRVLWRSRVRAPRELSWSADGDLLLVRAARSVRVLLVPAPVGLRATLSTRLPRAAEAVFAPHGRRIALIRHRRGTSQLLLATPDGRRTRLLFAGAGRLRGATWSPDGRWLVVAWPTADQLLFVRTTGGPQVEAVSEVAREFDPRAAQPRGAPVPAGWR